jgi:bacterioferritin-associated ferredoxin
LVEFLMTITEKEIKRAVKEGYARIAKQATSYYSSRSCCGCADIPEEISKRMGYSDEEISAAPPESNMGLGCGNPVALASLREGETVLDMGAGGIPIALAPLGGVSGMVIGVDITSEWSTKPGQTPAKADIPILIFGKVT